MKKSKLKKKLKREKERVLEMECVIDNLKGQLIAKEGIRQVLLDNSNDPDDSLDVNTYWEKLSQELMDTQEKLMDEADCNYSHPKDRPDNKKPDLQKIKEMSLADLTALRDELFSKLKLTLENIAQIEEINPDLLDNGQGLFALKNDEDKIIDSSNIPELRTIFHTVHEIKRRIKELAELC